MKVNEFLGENEIEVTELHSDLEHSWYDYLEEHIKKVDDMGRIYDDWFEENYDVISDIVKDVARRDYDIELD